MAGRAPKYKTLGGYAGRYYILDHPNEWRDIPKKYQDPLFEAIDDLVEALLKTERHLKAGRDPSAELVGVINSLCSAHDVLNIFKEAGVSSPKIFGEIHRTLETRRAELDPGPSQDHHL